MFSSVVTVDKSAGNIETRRRFRNYQLHLEWRVPEGTTGSGQSRGNSGLFLASTGRGVAGCELQILDSYRNETHVNGMAGSVYKQSPPLANPARPAGAWQIYDVVWTAPVFDEGGTLRAPACMSQPTTTVFGGPMPEMVPAASPGSVPAMPLAPFPDRGTGETPEAVVFKRLDAVRKRDQDNGHLPRRRGPGWTLRT